MTNATRRNAIHIGLGLAATAILSAGSIWSANQAPLNVNPAFDAGHAIATRHLVQQSDQPVATATATVQEDDPAWNCARNGNLICGSYRFRTLVVRLEIQPAVMLPGQWVRPSGHDLVTECFASYPNTLADKGIPNRELVSCLDDPDPRKSDPRVITVHQNHMNHLNHTAR